MGRSGRLEDRTGRRAPGGQRAAARDRHDPGQRATKATAHLNGDPRLTARLSPTVPPRIEQYELAVGVSPGGGRYEAGSGSIQIAGTVSPHGAENDDLITRS